MLCWATARAPAVARPARAGFGALPPRPPCLTALLGRSVATVLALGRRLRPALAGPSAPLPVLGRARLAQPSATRVGPRLTHLGRWANFLWLLAL